jgi:hypothetical protein
MKLKKNNKSNSIQLNDWGIFCNFARPVHLLRWRREKREWIEKLPLEFFRATENMRWLIKSGAMLRTPLWKVNNGHRETSHAPTTFLIIERPEHPWSHEIILRKLSKKPKITLNHRQKKVDPRSYAVITLYKNVKIQKYPQTLVILFFLRA